MSFSFFGKGNLNSYYYSVSEAGEFIYYSASGIVESFSDFCEGTFIFSYFSVTGTVEIFSFSGKEVVCYFINPGVEISLS